MLRKLVACCRDGSLKSADSGGHGLIGCALEVDHSSAFSWEHDALNFVRERLPSAPVWLEQLFASAVFAAQMKLAGRMAPSEDQLRRVLVLLEERKGTVIMDTLAQRLNVPEFRVNSIVTAVRKVMNVEGYAVVSLDDGAKTVTLNYDCFVRSSTWRDDVDRACRVHVF